jgi:hypothetical protein
MAEKQSGRTDINLVASISTDGPVGTPVYDFRDDEAKVEQNTGIERNGGVTNLYQQETTFTTAGANSVIVGDGSLLQVDSSHNVRIDNVAIGNVGPLSVHRRGILAGYLDAAWTDSNTIIGITKIGTVIKLDEFNPATGLVVNTRNITFATMPGGLIQNVALVKYPGMTYADAQEFVVSDSYASYVLTETGTTGVAISGGMSFVLRSASAFRYWDSVCWAPALSMFCAVAWGGAAAGQVMTSPDGIAWTARTAASAQNWASVCWSPELALFCAVASNGAVGVQVMTSPDGITWTSRTSASARTWRSVCWSPDFGLFVAVASDGLVATQVMYSADGITWVSSTSASAREWYSVCWSPSLALFCAVASDGLVATQVMTSPDGITWTSQTSASARQWRGICWSPSLSLFCAVAGDGGTVATQIMTSPDGIVWTSRTSPSDKTWIGVCWSPELRQFCVVATVGGAASIISSSDGITWTAHDAPANESWMSICWSPQLGIFCGVAQDDANIGLVMTSDFITVDTAWRFSANRYLFGSQGTVDSWMIGTVAAPARLSLWRWAIINRFPGTTYSRAILTRSPTQVATNLIGYGEVGYNPWGTWSATVTGYGPTLAAATATVTNPISAPGYCECTYVRTDTAATIHYYHAPDFSHISEANFANGIGNTHTPILAYGKLTDLWENILTLPGSQARIGALASLRTCMFPSGTTDGLASYLSAAPISTTTTLDHIGVPITLFGEFDDTFMPHVDDDAAAHSRIIYRYNGNLYYVSIETGQAKRIDKLDDTIYQVNCLSAFNIVDTTKRTLELGVTDYNGRTIPTNVGVIGANTKIAAVLRSPYANSIDKGDKLITNYAANASVSIPGIEIPAFIDRQVNYGVDVYIGATLEYEETYVSRYAYRIMADKEGVLYIADTRLPVCMGYAYGNRTVQTEVSTLFTGVGVTGSTDIDYGYAAYEIGNEIAGRFSSFTLFGQRYIADSFNLYLATFEGPVFSRKEFVCPAAGMVYIASSPTTIFFLSAFDNSLYVFSGGRDLSKLTRMNAMATITDGVYSTLDNTLLLQTASTLIWIRDDVVTLNAKLGTQTGTALYVTTGGIVIANNTMKWRYTYAALSGSTVVSLTWQSPYLGLRNSTRSIATDWTLTLYNPAPTTAITATLTCDSFDETGYSSNSKAVILHPNDWSTLGFSRVRIQPKIQRALASSVKIVSASRVVLTDVSVQWEEESAITPRATRSL